MRSEGPAITATGAWLASRGGRTHHSSRAANEFWYASRQRNTVARSLDSPFQVSFTP